MNPSTALARTLIDELVRGGVRDLVLSPGSRSAPLAYAAHDAARAGRLRLHVRIDERTAGFLALGVAQGSRAPAVVITTSGTAVANLYPAVLEAHHSGVPVVVVSADRPAELRGTGANQTTTQPGIFGEAVRWSADIPAPESVAAVGAYARSSVCRALAAARGGPRGGVGCIEPGPVHLNVGFRDPLTPDAGDSAPGQGGRADGRPWTEVLDAAEVPDVAEVPDAAGAFATAVAATLARPIADVPRTVVVIGDLAPSMISVDEVVSWATNRGYPVVAEPFGAFDRSAVLPHGPLVLTDAEWLAAHRPDRVLVVGRPTLSRAVAGLLRLDEMHVEVCTATSQWADPGHVARAVHPLTALVGDHSRTARSDADRQWSAQWRHAGSAVAQAVQAAPPSWDVGLGVARCVGEALPDDANLFIGSSNPVRDLDLAMARSAPLTVHANRGLAGVDGCLSTAIGLALTLETATYAWVGDLTFIHDSNALVIGPDEPAPDLTILVTNDGGGGIFRTLEHGAPERDSHFDRVFGTPTYTDLAALCGAHGIRHRQPTTRAELLDALRATPDGITVVEVAVDPTTHRDAHAELRRVAHDALAASD